jgi:uracil-DNA glycosylase
MELSLVNKNVDIHWGNEYHHQLAEYYIDKIPPPLNEEYAKSWRRIFDEGKYDIATAFYHILRLQQNRPLEFFPHRIFSAFQMTPLSQVRVVIFGQDPYHSVDETGAPYACGLAFSTFQNQKPPPTLFNIYKELSCEYPSYVKPRHGDLSSWTQQGVLLLNTSLTVVPHQPNSHKGLWICFIKRVLSAIAEVNPRCIYVLWGRESQNEIKPLLKKDALILESAHPSPLSASRGFFGNNHFIEINNILARYNSPLINWQN